MGLETKRRKAVDMAYEMVGTVETIGEIETYGSNGGTKRELVIKTGDKYPQLVSFMFFKMKCDQLDGLYVGDEVKVKFDISGRRATNGKVYVSLNAWNVSQEGRENEQGAPAKPQTGSNATNRADEAKNALNSAGIGTDDDGDSIPF
jgi:hypothetical protein